MDALTVARLGNLTSSSSHPTSPDMCGSSGSSGSTTTEGTKTLLGVVGGSGEGDSAFLIYVGFRPGRTTLLKTTAKGLDLLILEVVAITMWPPLNFFMKAAKKRTNSLSVIGTLS